eukprot:UN14274
MKSDPEIICDEEVLNALISKVVNHCYSNDFSVNNIREWYFHLNIVIYDHMDNHDKTALLTVLDKKVGYLISTANQK